MQRGRGLRAARLVLPSLVLLFAVIAGNDSSERGAAAGAAPSGYALAPAFGEHGMMTFPTWTQVRDIAVLADGSALVQLDRHDGSGGLLATGVAKVRPNGTLDAAFASSGSTPGIVEADARWGALTVMSDGGFFVGSRRYRSDGSVDSTYGADGYFAINGSMFANAPTAIIEVNDHRLAMVSDASAFDDCYIFPINESGSPGPLVSTGVLCSEAIPLRLPDGSMVVVLHEISTGYHLLRLAADGTLDRSFGNAGVVTVDPEIGTSPRLIAAAASPDGGILLLPQGYVHSGVIARIRLDGTLDPAFGSSGKVGIQGVAQALSVDASSAPLIGVGYTFLLHSSMPYHPALLQLTSSGQTDHQFNTSGIQPGWQDMTELGIDEPAIGGPQAQIRLDHLLVGMAFGPTGTAPKLAVLVELEPIPLTPPPTPETIPATTIVEHAITAAAQATGKAIRIGVIPGP